MLKKNLPDLEQGNRRAYQTIPDKTLQGDHTRTHTLKETIYIPDHGTNGNQPDGERGCRQSDHTTRTKLYTRPRKEVVEIIPDQTMKMRLIKSYQTAHLRVTIPYLHTRLHTGG